MNDPETLELLRNELQIQLDMSGEITLTPPGPYGPKDHEIQVLLKYNLDEDGGGESGPNLRIDPISWFSLRFDTEGAYLVLFNLERFPTEDDEIAYAYSANSFSEFMEEDPDAIIRLSQTSSASTVEEIAKEVSLLISAFEIKI